MIRGNGLLKLCMIAALLLVGSALSSDDRVTVNMMIDLELNPYSLDDPYRTELSYLNATIPVPMTNEQKTDIEWASRMKILNEIQPKGLNVTLYLTGDYLNERVGDNSYGLSISSLSILPNYEMALHGMTTDETLENLSYREQDSRIANSKMHVEENRICDGKERKAVRGFRPQRFSQNEDTHQILDTRNFLYNAGYQAGLIYLSGHEKDTWPYPVDNHSFYAVPVSTHFFEGELIPMEDRFAYEKGLNGTQWRDLLISEYEECSKNGDPMVVIFHNFVIGLSVIGLNEGYLDAYQEFVNYLTSDNAEFVTTQQLVDMSMA